MYTDILSALYSSKHLLTHDHFPRSVLYLLMNVMCVFVRRHVCVCALASVPACVRACIRACVHACVRECVQLGLYLLRSLNIFLASAYVLCNY